MRSVFRFRAGLILPLLLAALTACGNAAPAQAPAGPTIAALAAPTVATLSAEQTAEVIKAATAQRGASAVQGLTLHTFQFRDPKLEPFVVVYTSGESADGSTPHFVAVYRKQANNWLEASIITLTNPMMVDQDAVKEVAFAPDRSWIEVRGRSGLVGPCCYDLLSFDGNFLDNKLSFADGTLNEVTLEQGPDSKPLVRLSATPFDGVENNAAPMTKIFSWDGQQMTEQ
ncbi:MAG TPA: hypothetical protein VFS21_34910 [Roseiflexaceae bacterium]|nr:hypothetical protein [Roseiflexaceae bacterium]